MRQYLDLLRHIKQAGVRKNDRTKTGTLSVFGYQMRFNLAEGFPLLTTKRVHVKSVVHELLWFLRGDTNIAYLRQNGVSIWNEWADENGELGPVYGKQWRRWESVEHSNDGFGTVTSVHATDQIAEMVHLLRKDPDSRRMVVSAWHPGENERMGLMPCHCLFQFYVAEGKLSCQLYQRSADVFLGVPFNIASYALLTAMMAHVTGLVPGEFIWTGGDTHLYLNHLTQVDEQLARAPGRLPRLVLDPQVQEIDAFRFEHIQVVDYEPQAPIKAPVAV